MPANSCKTCELEIFTNAFTYAAIGMALVAPDGAWLKANNSFCELVEYTESELLSMTFQDITHPDDLDEDVSFVRKMLNKEIDTYQIEKRYISKHGKTIHVLLSVSLVSNKEGTPLFFISQIQDVSKVKQYESDLLRLLYEDFLTKIGNRRFFFENAERELRRSSRHFESLSILIIDVDSFKHINDSFGHDVGDEVLRTISGICKESVRDIDLVGRIGGEEFAILLVDTDFDDAKSICERLRKNVENTTVSTSVGEIKVTVSIGCHVFVGPDKGLDYRLKRADEALYIAKNTGKNRIEYCFDYDTISSSKNPVRGSFIKLVWDRSLESGNKMIDEQHELLFELSNNLLCTIMSGSDNTSCLDVLDLLAKHIAEHFSTEEEILELTNYPDLDCHRDLHKKLIACMEITIDNYLNDALSISELFIFLAVEVVYNHLVIEDSKYFEFLEI